MREARRMNEKAVVMLCISASRIRKRCCPLFCTWGMDKSWTIKWASVSREHELRSLGEPCSTEICGDTKCFSVCLTDTGVHDNGAQHWTSCACSPSAALQHWDQTRVQCSDNLISAEHKALGSWEAAWSGIREIAREKLCPSHKYVYRGGLESLSAVEGRHLCSINRVTSGPSEVND